MSAETEKASTALTEFMSAMKEWENKFANEGPEAHAAARGSVSSEFFN
jgi:hypothetical protein